MEETKKPELTPAELNSRRDSLWTKTGQHQFTKAVLEAELLQMNQEILDLNNKLAKLSAVHPEAPRVVEAEVV